MAKDDICNTNGQSNNNDMNPPPLKYLLVMLTQLLETVVQMQHANQKMLPVEGRTPIKKDEE
jgi:hypothetical protein